MAQIGTVTLSGLPHSEFQYTWVLASGITAADSGKAVTLDATAPNTVKLAADGDDILGRLETVEVRVAEGVSVGTVSLFGGMKFPVASGLAAGDVPDVGEYLSGGGAGGVKGSATKSKWLVVEMNDDDTYATAVGI